MKKSKLPLEIEDTIMNLYWKSIFYNKIILFLIHKEEELIDTFYFIQTTILPKIKHLHKIEYNHYLCKKYNNKLKEILHNKSICMYLQRKHKIINYNINNINYYKDIEDDFKYITYYLCVLSGYNRFQIINALKKLIIHFMC